MGYAAKQDMIDRFGEDELIQLTDRNNAGVIDDAVLNGALADADAQIDPYLASRYSLPLAGTPVVIKRVACNLARYFLYDDAATEQVQKAFDQGISFLKSISKGEVSLGLDDGGAAPTTADNAEMQSGGRIFSRDDNSYI